MQFTETREGVALENLHVSETQGDLISQSAESEPVLVVKASDKFAPQIVRLLADLKMAHSDTDPADILELHQLSEAMDNWRTPPPPPSTTNLNANLNHR